MKMWYVYLLRCEDGTRYTGITKDLYQRMRSHAAGNGSSYVAGKGFDILLYAVQAENRSQASKAEHHVKSLRPQQKTEWFQAHDHVAYQALQDQ
jgi:putative endonuclease